ncbi:sporulation integral membrane protein YtvI [Shouchella shacheensis]|uniref:sporulation integral membrane protein YtvI n=1 Tax=Shouchella shacheensis TaxID=1649580 RepID=UPI0009EAE630|nr:sporulation integral membrane protein YtvI [Shouchella shacheensis]
MVTRHFAWMVLRMAIIVAIIAASVWLFARIFSLTYPFWLAALFAWMLQPVVRFLQHRLRFNSGFASLFGLLGGILVISGIVTGLVFLVYYSLREFFEQAPQWIEEGTARIQIFFNNTILPHWQQVLGLFDNLDTEQHDLFAQLGSRVADGLGNFGQTAFDWVIGVPSFLVAFFFIILSIYFMGKSWSFYEDVYERNVPGSLRRKAREFIHALQFRFLGFVRAQLILMLVTAVIVFIGLLILGIEHAWMLAIVVGIAELLPYLGTGTILIPWFIYLFITGDISGGLGIAILYAIILIVRQLLEPKILSSNMNLNPVAVLISLFAGLQAFGAVGLFIGPLLLVLIVILGDIGFFKTIFSFIKEGFQDERPT